MYAGLWEAAWASGDAHLCPVHCKYLNVGLDSSDADTNKLSIYSCNLCNQTYTGKLSPGVINLWVRQIAEVLGVHLVSHQSQLCRFSISAISNLLPYPFPSSTKAALLFVCVKLYSLETVVYWRLRSKQKFLETVCGWNSSFIMCLAVWIVAQLQMRCRKDFDG